MAAPKGNRFWEARSSHGRRPIFNDPDDLWEACLEYFEWVDDNPLLAAETVKFHGEATLTQVPKMRAMTISGLCIFLDISEDTWARYRKKNDLSGVTTRVERIIYTQKFSGAAAEMLNANIIARDLGLKDLSSREVKGALAVVPVDPDASPQQAAEIYQQLIKGDSV